MVRRTLASAAAVSICLLAACGDDAGGGATTTAPGSEATTTTGEPLGDGDEHGQGHVVIDGEVFTFTVSACGRTGDQVTFAGEGEANVLFGTAGLLVQVPDEGRNYSVPAFVPTVEGNSITGGGAGQSVTGSGDVSIELTATCDQF